MIKREANVTSSATSSKPQSHPSNDEIAVRAYELFIARGEAPGNDVDDWLQAERELLEKNRDAALLQSMAIR